MKSVLLAYRTAKYIEGSRLLSSIFLPLSHLWKDAAGYRKIGQFSFSLSWSLGNSLFLNGEESSDMTRVDYII